LDIIKSRYIQFINRIKELDIKYPKSAITPSLKQYKTPIQTNINKQKIKNRIAQLKRKKK
jgi:hypothetical protein